LRGICGHRSFRTLRHRAVRAISPCWRQRNISRVLFAARCAYHSMTYLYFSRVSCRTYTHVSALAVHRRTQMAHSRTCAVLRSFVRFKTSLRGYACSFMISCIRAYAHASFLVYHRSRLSCNADHNLISICVYTFVTCATRLPHFMLWFRAAPSRSLHYRHVRFCARRIFASAHNK